MEMMISDKMVEMRIKGRMIEEKTIRDQRRESMNKPREMTSQTAPYQSKANAAAKQKTSDMSEMQCGRAKNNFDPLAVESQKDRCTDFYRLYRETPCI